MTRCDNPLKGYYGWPAVLFMMPLAGEIDEPGSVNGFFNIQRWLAYWCSLRNMDRLRFPCGSMAFCLIISIGCRPDFGIPGTNG